MLSLYVWFAKSSLISCNDSFIEVKSYPFKSCHHIFRLISVFSIIPKKCFIRLLLIFWSEDYSPGWICNMKIIMVWMGSIIIMYIIIKFIFNFMPGLVHRIFFQHGYQIRLNHYIFRMSRVFFIINVAMFYRVLTSVRLK